MKSRRERTLDKGMNPKLAAALSLYVPGVWYGPKQPLGVSGQAKRMLHAAGFLERDRQWVTPYNCRSFFRLHVDCPKGRPEPV